MESKYTFWQILNARNFLSQKIQPIQLKDETNLEL